MLTFALAKIHFTSPKSSLQPAKCATLPDKEMLINIKLDRGYFLIFQLQID